MTRRLALDALCFVVGAYIGCAWAMRLIKPYID